MHEARWYPTLTTLSDGKILSVSGLDDIGQLVPGKKRDLRPEDQGVDLHRGDPPVPDVPLRCS